MKTIKYIALSLLVGGSIASCQDDYENVSENNRVYDTARDFVNVSVLDGKNDEITRTLSVRMAQPENQPVYVTYGVNEAKLADYKAIFGGDPVLLPSENYVIEEPTAVIEPQTVQSSAVEVKFTGLTSLNDEFVYVLPVSIISSTVPAIETTATTYYVFRGAALVNYSANFTGTCTRFVNEGQCPELGNLTKMTVEVLLNPDELSKQISTLIGIEGTFVLRIGDAGVEPNQLQIGGPGVTDPAWRFECNKWTFLTLTWDGSTGDVNVYFDGVKKGDTQHTNVSRVNWNVVSEDRACYIGYSYDTDRDFRGDMCEMRIWNKVLTPAEINERNHFYRVDPEAEGLVAYWKMDEGEGNVIKDYANGYDMYVPATYPGKASKPGNLGWISVSLP